ncbi:MAG: hypothetical protein ACRDNP_04875 [Gaiellaceae bacterium]
MISLLLLAAGTIAVLVSATFLSAVLRPPGPVVFALDVYVVAWAEVVVLLLVLSPMHAVQRPMVLLGTVLFAIAGAGAWHLAGRPALPDWNLQRQIRELLREAVLVVLAVASAAAVAYAAALVLLTPQNDFDSMWYHLPRAALWGQQQAIGHIAGANFAAINEYPPPRRSGCCLPWCSRPATAMSASFSSPRSSSCL